jgi:hypothetical protein
MAKNIFFFEINAAFGDEPTDPMSEAMSRADF